MGTRRFVQQAALIAAIGAALSWAPSLWGFFFVFSHLSQVGLQAALVLLFQLAEAMIPVFFFLLYRYQGRLQISDNLRQLAYWVLIVWGVLVVYNAWALLSAPNQSVLETAPLYVRALPFVRLISNLAYALLLLAFCRHTDDPEDRRGGPSPFFRIATAMVVVVAVTLVGLAIWNLTHLPSIAQVRELYSKNGRTPPTPWMMYWPQVNATLYALCLLTSPVIVWLSTRVADQPEPLPVPSAE